MGPARSINARITKDFDTFLWRAPRVRRAARFLSSFTVIVGMLRLRDAAVAGRTPPPVAFPPAKQNAVALSLAPLSVIVSTNDDVLDAVVPVERGTRILIMKPRLQSADAARALGVSPVS
jgi:hypothetical protein